MAVIGTFGSFTAARLGIYASQSSLNVTGNNIANINTKGYTRQRMDLVSLHSAGSSRYSNGFNLDIGYGVLADSVSQLRDPFMDIRYRDEQSLVGASETWLKNLQQLSHTLDEVGKGNDFGVLEKQFNELANQLQQLNGAVGTPEYDTTVRSSAEVLCQLFNSYSKALETVADNQLETLQGDVKTVNSILNRIRGLNEEIREAGIYHNNALELRDQRNVLIDELSYYMKIDVRYSMEPLDEFSSVEKLSITIADSGNPPIELINGIYGTQIEMPEKTAMRNPNYDPNFKPADPMNPTADEEKKMRKYVSAVDANGLPTQYTDEEKDAIEVDNAVKGSDENRLWMSLQPLQTEKGKILKDANGKEYQTVLLGDNTIYGSLQSMREFITEKGEFSSELDMLYDPKATSKRGVPYYRKSLDSLAQKFAETLNEANQIDFDKVMNYYKNDGTNFLDQNGNPLTVQTATFKDLADALEAIENDPQYVTSEQKEQAKQLYKLENKDKFEQAYKELEDLRQNGVLKPEYAYYNGGVLFSSSGDTNDPTGITAKNITISKGWSTGDVRILNTKKPDTVQLDENGKPILNEDGSYKMVGHSTANDNVAHIVNLMTSKIDYLPREVDANAAGDKRYFSGSFQGRLADMNVVLSVDEQATGTMYDSYTIKALNLDNDRQSVSGVDLNDEATNMMVFQKSYSAACQLMTTLDSMLDKLINGTIR
ncbi:MAG: hypothetical protein HFF38_05185 [Lawsonibacter sp.]|nr:hypothetical protein [Lawsonibacter sp.]